MTNTITAAALTKRILAEQNLKPRQVIEGSKNYQEELDATHRGMLSRFGNDIFLSICPFMEGYLELLIDFATGEDKRLLKEKIVEILFKRVKLQKILDLVNASRESVGKDKLYPIQMYRLYINKVSRGELPRYRQPSDPTKNMLKIFKRIDRKKYLEIHKAVVGGRYDMAVRNNLHADCIFDPEILKSFSGCMTKSDIRAFTISAITRGCNLNDLEAVSAFFKIVDVNLKRMFITALEY